MIKSKRQMFTIISIFTLVLFVGSISYAWFNYRSESGEQSIIAGDIYLKLNEGQDEIELTNVFPETAEEARSRDDNYITFSVNGKNTSNKTIYYEFVLNHGTEKASPKSRYNDEDLRFDLVELDSNGDEVDYILSNVSYDTLVNKRIYADTIDSNTTNQVNRYYKLRTWIDEGVVISDTETNRDYTTEEYKNGYATVKLIVSGDFTEKDYAKPLSSLIKKLSSTNNYIASYQDVIDANPGLNFTTQDQVSTNAPKQTVYYYTGEDAAANANVLFAGYCWQIIRTTDNGGVRMIYNGVAVNNKCETTRTATKGINKSDATNQSMGVASLYGRSYDYDLDTGEFTIEDSTGLPSTWTTSDNNSNGTEDYKELIGTYTCLSSSATCSTLYYVGSINPSNSAQAYVAKYTIGDVAHYSQLGKNGFNTNYYSPALVGYMFNTEYDYKEGSKSGEYYTNAVWENGAYALSNGNSGTAPDTTHHYICDSDCTKVRYYYYVDGSTHYYILLENGMTIEDAVYQMTGNGTPEIKAKAINTNYKLNNHNSAMKGYLDNWYKKNLTAYASYLDSATVYCNDRSISNLGGWNPSGGGITGSTAYLKFYQNSVNRNLNCVNETDRFAVTNSKAELTYPIGLLTEPERNLMTAYYAKSGQDYWMCSPLRFEDHRVRVLIVNSLGINSSDYVNYSYGVRAVVTLKPGTKLENGTGTYIDPYVVGPIVDRNS